MECILFLQALGCKFCCARLCAGEALTGGVWILPNWKGGQHLGTRVVAPMTGRICDHSFCKAKMLHELPQTELMSTLISASKLLVVKPASA